MVSFKASGFYVYADIADWKHHVACMYMHINIDVCVCRACGLGLEIALGLAYRCSGK